MNKHVLAKVIFPILIICLSLIPLIDLLHPGLPFTHDGRDHVARIANFYQNLQEGNFIPRWAGNLNWGYGHPVLMFLYPLQSYFASIFHYSGFSFVDSTKMVFAISYILSGLTMYLWLKEFLPKQGAFIGSLLYIFAPYRFVDLYVRGAIGEHVAFIFPPMVLYFLLKISNSINLTGQRKMPAPYLRSGDAKTKTSGASKQSMGENGKYLIFGSLSLAALILSHNAISLMFLPIIMLYIIFLIFNSKNKLSLILNTCFLILMGFSLSAFFWMPALAEGKYTLRDIVTSGSIEKNFANFFQLIYGPWSYGISGQFTLQIGILHWLSVLFAFPVCFYLYKKKNSLFVFTIGILIIFFISIFLVTGYSQIIWKNISIMQKFQFPWRFLSVSVFTSSVIGALVLSYFPKSTNPPLLKREGQGGSKNTVFLIILTSIILFLNKGYWHAKSYLYFPDSYYSSVYKGTTDTGESSPIWSVRFMEKQPKSQIEVISGKAGIKKLISSSTFHEYLVDAESTARLKENTLFFPGWTVMVDNKPVEVQYQDPDYRGIMTFKITKGMHDVVVKFEETKTRLVADIISGSSFLILVIISIAAVIKSSSRKSKVY